jgi:pimeloyl-ACP methyl ester carboxylesterase
LLYQNGFAVLVIDSTFSWQFVNSRAGCRLPGFLPDDARAVREVIKLALNDLKKDELISNPEIILTGYSFGGMHTLKIAELEKNDPQINFKKYLAVNPPVSLAYAAVQADKMAEAMNKYQPQQVVDKVINTAGILMADMAHVTVPFRENMSDFQKVTYRLQADPETAAFLAGLYFRSSMRSMLFAAHRERGLIPLSHLPVEFKRNKLYLELDKITFKEYAEKYLASEYPGVSLDTLYRKSDLNSLADTLKNDEKIHVLHSINDFLLSENDRKFLDSTLENRITWTSRGGHLGNLYYEKVQQKILKMLK